MESLAIYPRNRYILPMDSHLREPTFLVLAALAAGPLHGYGIIQQVAALSDGRLTLRPGTLYGALDRLADEGLIELDQEEVVAGRLRRYYRITDRGAGMLAAETERLERIAGAARQRIAQGERARQQRPAGPVTGRPLPGLAGTAGGVA